MLNTGAQLGPYEIVAPLGAGGMGEVYRAKDSRLDREVAIKVLPERTARDPQALARFEREAKAVAALSHPNILAVYDVGRHEDISYVVMELLEGETLRSRITRSALPSRKAIEMGIEIAEGLSAAHAKGVVHRDLKPENIFLTADGHVKILDFGLARSTGAVQGTLHDLASSPTLTIGTTPGAIIGTLCYMAPEQVRALATDARTDIFAFGCVMYEMLTAQRAFLGETAADTMTAILKEEPKSVRTLSASVGPELERLIDRCLEKRPEQRFQSSTDLAFSLRSILSHDEHPHLAPPSTRWLTRAGIAVVLLAAVILGLWALRSESRQTRHEGRDVIDSLAVLPFANASGNDSFEYLGDGMTESLINTLSRIERLRVIPTSTAFRYKGRSVDPETVSRELHVRAVVTGKVDQRGDQTIIQAELIDATTGSQLWGERYDRPAADLLTIERDITKEIVDSLQMRLTGEEKRAAAKRSTENEQAYRLYLEGRYWWKKRTEEGLTRALQLFSQALSLDRNYSLAQVGQADCYLLLGCFYRSARDMFPSAQQAAENALGIDPTLAEAYAPLAFLKAVNDREWEASLDLFCRGIALNPRYPTLHHWYGLMLDVMGRAEEAERETTLAVELDPGAVVIQRELGSHFVRTRQYDRAIGHLRRAIEADPTFFLSYSALGEALAATKDYEGAIAAFRKMHELAGRIPMHAGQVARIDALAGRRKEALDGLQNLLELDKGDNVFASAIASVYIALGDQDQAFSWLERAVDRREMALLYTLQWPRWDPVRDDPRFDSLLRRVGLPPLTPTPSTISSTKPSKERITLAVLPFANDSGDAELDYLSDGVAETLINGFSRIDGMNTVPRSTAFRHKGDNADPVQIGRQLSATAVLTGRVLKRGDNLTIQAELVDVAEGRQLWGERYQRKFADLVVIERGIAGEITDALRLRLTGDEKRRLSRGYSENAEAYRLYLQGRFWWSKRTKEGFDNALRLLGQAIVLDPTFALAYSGIADTYSLMPLYGYRTPREALAEAHAAADMALQLDDQLAEAHTSMGMVRMYLTWNFDESEKNFKHAMLLNPRYPTAHQWYALCVGARGRFAEARTELRRAIELDPLMPIFTHNLSWISVWEHDWPQTLSMAKAGLEFAPEFPWLHQSAGIALLELERADESLAHLRKAVELAPSASYAVAYLGYGLARTGHEQEARALLAERLEATKSHYVPPTDIATIYVGLGEFDETFRWLEKGFEVRDTWMMFLGVLTQWDPLRDDPRFVDLLRRVGLPQNQERSNGK